MAATFEDVLVSSLSESLIKTQKIAYPVTLFVADEYENLNFVFRGKYWKYLLYIFFYENSPTACHVHALQLTL